MSGEGRADGQSGGGCKTGNARRRVGGNVKGKRCKNKRECNKLPAVGRKRVRSPCAIMACPTGLASAFQDWISLTNCLHHQPNGNTRAPPRRDSQKIAFCPVARQVACCITASVLCPCSSSLVLLLLPLQTANRQAPTGYTATSEPTPGIMNQHHPPNTGPGHVEDRRSSTAQHSSEGWSSYLEKSEIASPAATALSR